MLLYRTSPRQDYILDLETKSLRDARDILETVGVEDALQYIQEHSHPRLWRLLAEGALERLDLAVADKAFVKCSSYAGIQFVKKLQRIKDSVMQKAEVAAYFQRFDDAEVRKFCII